MNEGLVFLISQSKHLQLGTPYVHRKGMRILRLIEVLKLHGLGLENKHYHHIKNFLAGEVFLQGASQQNLYCKKNGDKIYNEMIKE